jgi:hypothetical protein
MQPQTWAQKRAAFLALNPEDRPYIPTDRERIDNACVWIERAKQAMLHGRLKFAACLLHWAADELTRQL